MRVSGCRRHLVSVAIGLSSVLLANLSVQAQESNSVRIQHNRSDGAIVGERVSLRVQILTDTWLNQAATITVPEVPGLLILKVSSFGVNGTERVGAVTYTTQAHEFALFARRSGRFLIPPFRVRFGVAGQPAGTKIMLDFKTDPIELVAEMPPGAEGVEGLIAAPALSLTETWDPDPGNEFSVGDAIKRSVTYRAESVMGMAFPPSRFPPVDGLGVYPQPPELDDQTERGDFLGSRTDAVTYVFERSGTFVLPGLTVPWWDLAAGQLREAALPSRTVVITGADVDADDAVAQTTKESGSWWVWYVTGLLLVGAVSLRPVRTWMKERVETWRSWREERRAFRDLIRACGSGESEVAYRKLRRWHGIAMPDHILSVSAAEYGEPRLLEEMRDLERCALAAEDGWKGSELADLIPHWRRYLKTWRSHRIDEGLPPLNP